MRIINLGNDTFKVEDNGLTTYVHKGEIDSFDKFVMDFTDNESKDFDNVTFNDFIGHDLQTPESSDIQQSDLQSVYYVPECEQE